MAFAVQAQRLNMKKPGIQHLKYLAICLLASLFVLNACRQDEVTPDQPVNQDYLHVNSWIKENMDFWYYWNKGLPSAPNLNVAPPVFFESLLNPADRFSFIAENYHELLNSLQGITREAGYEFILYLEKPGSNNVLLQIVYVKPDSPAEGAGLQRGDVVTHINGKQITRTNFQSLLDEISRPHSVVYRALNLSEEDFEQPKTVSLSAVEYAENPNFLDEVMDIEGKKIGYFVYNFFASGTDQQPGAYDAEMDAIFANFKTEGIEELIVDLRFNSGGSESSARHLASLIGRSVDQTKIFLRREYNDDVEQEILNDANLGADFLVSHFENNPSNIGAQLASGRVYILTSSRTASASELVINALKPFMEVFLIGDTTVGKNVGSISLYADDDPKNTWGMQPIVVKVLNSQGQADYSHGFVPDILQQDNQQILYPLGDPRELLLSRAIAEITGTTISRQAQARSDRKILAHSLDYKRRSFRLVVDEMALPIRR